jgi:chitodextrinase
MTFRVTRRTALVAATAALVATSGLWIPSPVSAAPPAPPPVVRAVAVTPTEVDVEWEPGGPDTTSYVVRRDGAALATVDAATLTYADTTVVAGTHYVYVVEAQSPGGTAAGPPARVKTPSPPQRPDRVRPTVPMDVQARAQADGSVLIDWQYSNDDSDISGYIVRRDHRRLTIVDAGTLRFVDNLKGAPPSAYTVEAVDIAGLRSGESPPAPVQPVAAAGVGGATPSATSGALATTAFAPALRRYPYLTDVVNSADAATGFATINWATDRSATTGAAQFGTVDAGGSCTPSTTVTATRTALTVNSVLEYQWKAMLTLLPDTQYCYRITLGGLDLLGTDASPRFRTQLPTGSTAPLSFAVFGDWGSVDSVSSNPNQTALFQHLAASGVRFAVTTGDNAYSSGSQNNYGDLVETGPEIGGVFGPQQWTLAGATVPLFPTIGNHGFLRSDVAHPHLTNWPQDRAVSASNGRYQKDTYCCLLGTSSLSLPSTWYAFDAGRVRIYVLQAAWSDSNGGVNNAPYEVDAAYQWTPGSPQYQWLQSDLAAHPGQIKMAFFHYPLYSDQRHENSDTFLQGPNSLQGLLDQFGVKFSFFGHAHIYQRNHPDSAGMVSYLTGGGGAKSQSVHEDPCLAIDAYAIGWSNTNQVGNACGAASPPTSNAQVFHYLKVTVSGNQVTVAPTNSLGQTFDVQTYDVGGGGPPPDVEKPSVPTITDAHAVSSSEVSVTWSASTDNVGVDSYDVLRDGNIVGNVSGSTLTFSDTTAAASTTYSYQVRANDAAGNHSDPSTGVNVTTPAAPGPVTVSAVASDDTYADQQVPTTNFGSATTVFADTSPLQRGFLKFAATGVTGTVQSAVVRLFVTDSASNAPQLATSTSAWSESTVTWNSQPAAGPVVADLGNAATNTFIDYPVTPVVTGNGTYSFVLLPQSSNGLGVASSEATNTANRPQLRVTFLPAPADGAPPSAPSVTATAASSALVNVSWSGSADNVGVTGYDVMRDGSVIASVSGSTLAYADTAVAASTTYSYQVVAKDLAGNASAPSTASTVTTPAPTGPTTVQFVAFEDTYTDLLAPSTPFGTAPNIFSDTSPMQQGYLRFNVTGITGAVQNAVVRLLVTDSATNAPYIAATTGTWDESTTGANEPIAHGAAISDLGNAPTNTFIEYPVTAVVAGNGTYSFVLVPQSSNGLGVASSEATTAANQPQLVITYT